MVPTLTTFLCPGPPDSRCCPESFFYVPTWLTQKRAVPKAPSGTLQAEKAFFIYISTFTCKLQWCSEVHTPQHTQVPPESRSCSISLAMRAGSLFCQWDRRPAGPFWKSLGLLAK